MKKIIYTIGLFFLFCSVSNAEIVGLGLTNGGDVEWAYDNASIVNLGRNWCQITVAASQTQQLKLEIFEVKVNTKTAKFIINKVTTILNRDINSASTQYIDAVLNDIVPNSPIDSCLILCKEKLNKK